VIFALNGDLKFCGFKILGFTGYAMKGCTIDKITHKMAFVKFWSNFYHEVYFFSCYFLFKMSFALPSDLVLNTFEHLNCKSYIFKSVA
jgi:hypothetical protein